MFWLPIVVGLLLLIQVSLGDMCDVLLVGNEQSDFKGLFEVNIGDRTADLGDSEIAFAEVVNPLLQCRAGCNVIERDYTPDPLPENWETHPLNPDNWPNRDSNVGLSNPACFEKELSGGYDSNGYYRLQTGSYNAFNNFGGILGIEDEFNFTRRVDDFLDDIVNAKEELNQTQLIQDSRDLINGEEVTNALAEDYTGGGQYYDDIDDAITQINDIFDTLPSEAYDSSEDQIWFDIWEIPIGSMPVQSAIDANLALRNELSGAVVSLSSMRETIVNVTTSQTSLSSSLDDIESNLLQLEDTLLNSIEALDTTSSLTNAAIIYTFVAAPGHLDCSWLANTYSNIVEEDICVDYHDGLSTFAAGLGLLSAAGTILIIIMLDCGNPHRTTLLEEYDDKQTVELGSAFPQSRYPGLAFAQNTPSTIAQPVSNQYSYSKSDEIPQAYPVPYRSGSVTDTV